MSRKRTVKGTYCSSRQHRDCKSVLQHTLAARAVRLCTFATEQYGICTSGCFEACAARGPMLREVCERERCHCEQGSHRQSIGTSKRPNDFLRSQSIPGKAYRLLVCDYGVIALFFLETSVCIGNVTTSDSCPVCVCVCFPKFPVHKCREERRTVRTKKNARRYVQVYMGYVSVPPHL
jgi:hypothetical protein